MKIQNSCTTEGVIAILLHTPYNISICYSEHSLVNTVYGMQSLHILSELFVVNLELNQFAFVEQQCVPTRGHL